MGVVAEEKKKVKAQIDLRRLRDNKIKKIAELQKEVEAYNKQISAKRAGYRKAFLPELAENVIVACGMTDKDADCFTRSEFKGLREEIVKNITDWKKVADEVATKNNDSDTSADSDNVVKKMEEELVVLKAEKEKLEAELVSIKDDNTHKKLQNELEILKSENEKLASEKDDALKVNSKYNDVNLTQFECFVPTVFTITSKIGLRDELEKCKTIEEYRTVVVKILRWINMAVGKVNEVQNDVKDN